LFTKSGNSSLESDLAREVLLHHQNEIQTLKPKTMKTTTFIFSIILFSFAITSCQKENIGPSMAGNNDTHVKAVPAKPMETAASNHIGYTKIRYEVVVHLSNEVTICNSYLVELKDETGRLIGPSQKFIPGIGVYNFFETVSATGTRIARLVADPDIDRLVCLNELFTAPAIKTGKFLEGGSYTFDLYPQTTPQKLND
jgi:hypothetical protein